MIENESDPFSQHLPELMTAFKKKKIECASNCLFLTLFTGIVQICKKVGHLTATVDAQGVRGYKGFLWATQWLGYHCPCLGTQFHRYSERQLGGIKMEFASSEENR